MPNQGVVLIREYEEKGPDPDLVATTVLKIVSSGAPQLRYLIRRQANIVARLRQFFPERAFDMGVRNTFRLDRDA